MSTYRRGAFSMLVFWAAVAVVAYSLLSGGIALATLDECERSGAGTHKTWRVIPPEWDCG